jgi:hypothetical protein
MAAPNEATRQRDDLSLGATDVERPDEERCPQFTAPRAVELPA